MPELNPLELVATLLKMNQNLTEQIVKLSETLVSSQTLTNNPLIQYQQVQSNQTDWPESEGDWGELAALRKETTEQSRAALEAVANEAGFLNQEISFEN